jgi:hypothetical protein
VAHTHTDDMLQCGIQHFDQGIKAQETRDDERCFHGSSIINQKDKLMNNADN